MCTIIGGRWPGLWALQTRDSSTSLNIFPPNTAASQIFVQSPRLGARTRFRYRGSSVFRSFSGPALSRERSSSLLARHFITCFATKDVSLRQRSLAAFLNPPAAWGAIFTFFSEQIDHEDQKRRGEGRALGEDPRGGKNRRKRGATSLVSAATLESTPTLASF